MRFCITIVFLFFVSAPTIAEEFRSGFELGSVSEPTGWTLRDDGMSVVTARRALTGRRSLQITDKDDSERGSSCLTKSIKIQPGQTARITAACFLESGDARGLGLYLEFLDNDSKHKLILGCLKKKCLAYDYANNPHSYEYASTSRFKPNGP